MQPQPLLPPPKFHGQTGPKSKDGKVRSRANAFIHGLRATDDTFVSTLTPAQKATYRKIYRALNCFYNPHNAYEHLLVDRMAVQHLRMLRLYRLEAASLDSALYAPHSDVPIISHLDRFARYDVRIERQLRLLHNRFISLRIQNEKHLFKPFQNNE